MNDLLARAEMLEDVDHLTEAVTDVIAGTEGSGVMRQAVEGLFAALAILDPTSPPPGYDIGGSDEQRRNTGFGNDGEFLEALSDLEDDLAQHLTLAADLQKHVREDAEEAWEDLDAARQDLAAARDALAMALAMTTGEPCNGCHGAKTAAITAAETDISDAEAGIAAARECITDCEAATDLLDPLADTLVRALDRVRRVAPDLGEAFELLYEFVRRGGEMPRPGRWITSGTAAR
jgi:hypothetical protein